MAGFDSDFSAKLAIDRTSSDAHAAAAQAQAGLLSQQAAQVAANAESQRNLQGSQANLFGTQATLAPLDFLSQDKLRSAQGAEGYARANLFGVQANLAPGEAADASRASRLDGYGLPSSFSTGTSKVPGTGDGTVDKVPAKLAPGEAVLNKAAAEHLGRDTIALLNAIGSAKMGLNVNPQTAAPEPAKGEQGYAKGTAKVAAKGKSKGSGKASEPAGSGSSGGMSPQIMQALMQMQQGGGMPAPGGQQPLPMDTPQVAPR